jgi:hypothetical protein
MNSKRLFDYYVLYLNILLMIIGIPWDRWCKKGSQEGWLGYCQILSINAGVIQDGGKMKRHLFRLQTGAVINFCDIRQSRKNSFNPAPEKPFILFNRVYLNNLFRSFTR